MPTNTMHPHALAPSPAPQAADFRYGTPLVALHWLMFLLMVAVYASIELRELFPKGTDNRELLKSLHFMLGLSTLAMVLLRLVARWLSPKPVAQAASGIARWTDLAARWGHAALYLLLVVMPLLGWLTLSAAGKPIPFFGLELPALIGPDKAFSKDLKELHETIGTIGYWLIGGHVLAALGHHYLLKDGLMSRMRWPQPT